MAVLVHDGIFVGNGSDIYRFAGSILHCARDPWFTEELARNERQWKYGASYYGEWRLREHGTVLQPAYNEMALNMVDAEHPKYFSDEMVNAGLEFITERLAEGDACLVHCNAGVSRSPSLVMLWLYEHGFLADDFDVAVAEFKSRYPLWSPAAGIWQYLQNRCSKQTNSELSSS